MKKSMMYTGSVVISLVVTFIWGEIFYTYGIAKSAFVDYESANFFEDYFIRFTPEHTQFTGGGLTMFGFVWLFGSIFLLFSTVVYFLTKTKSKRA